MFRLFFWRVIYAGILTDIRRFYGSNKKVYEDTGENTVLVLITYDVNTEDSGGRKRLRKVAKKCQDYGQRVQNSVFECLLDPGQYKILRAELLEIIDIEKDSLRFYFLGNQYKNKIEHIGVKESYDPEGLLML